MKKGFRLRLFITTLAAVLVITCGTSVSFADTPIRETNVYSAGSGKTLVTLEGEFTVVDKAKILKKINDIRKEACEEGIRNPDNPSKKLTMKDYVELKWSADLEWIAQTRAVEASMNRVHDRPNGQKYNRQDIDNDIWLEYNGSYSQAEILAWNSYTDTMHGINQWYKEKSDWKNKNDSKAGHYKQMINPANTYIGLATFKPAGYYATICGEFRKYAISDTTDESHIGVSGRYRQAVEVSNSHLTITDNVPSKIKTGTTKTVGFSGQTKFTKNSESIVYDVLLYEPVFWRSSDENVVFIDKLGNMTGVSEGEATVYAIRGNNVKEFNVKVLDDLPTITLPKPSISKLTKGTKRFTVKWKKKTGVKGYKIQYCLTSDFSGAKTVTVKSYKTTSKTIKGLKGNRRYYVRMRTYKIVDGDTYYSDWSKTKSVVPKK